MTAFRNFLALMILIQGFAFAEIQKILITWDVASCVPGCDNLLQRYFRQVRGVTDIKVNRGAGEALILWRPDTSFAFSSIDTALRLVGLNPNTIRMQVRGHIRQQGQNTALISSGDGTPFYLLNPVSPSLTQYTETESVFNRQLDPQTRQQLLDAASADQQVIIEGPLFQPERSPPLFLVIASMRAEPPAEDGYQPGQLPRQRSYQPQR